MPSLINELAAKQLKEMVDANTAFIFLDSSKLNAEEILKFRRELKDVGARLRVGKVRLIKKVVSGEVVPHLNAKGSVGMIAGPDIGAAAKVVKKLNEGGKIAVRASLVEGRAFDSKDTLRLADLPSKKDLQAKVVGLLAAPMTNFLRLLKAPAQNLTLVVEAYRKKQAGG